MPKTNKIRWSRDEQGTWIECLVSTKEAAEIVQKYDSGKEYEITIKEYHRKRSLSANGYFWVLADKLSAALRIPAAEIYKEYIQDVGGNSVIVTVAPDRLDAWNRVWCEGHQGRTTVDLGEVDGMHEVQCYLGSSDYDTAQMARLIDLIISDCKTVGIETLPPEEVERLKRAWKHG